MNLTNVMEQREAGLNQVLAGRGVPFRLERIRTFKNNRCLDGFTLRDPARSICPTVYMDEALLTKSDDSLADFLCGAYAEYDIPDFDVRSIISSDYILEHVRPRLYAASNEDGMRSHGYAFRSLEDTGLIIGFYLPISAMTNGTATAMLTENIIENANLTVPDVFMQSVRNLSSEFFIKNMCDLLHDCGIPEIFDLPMWVVSNQARLFGAAAILCPNVIEEIQRAVGERFYILPSSIHEVIVLPFTDEDADALRDMVCEINSSVLALEDRLLDGVLMYNGDRIVAL